jgi:hypothetical protein
MRLQYQKMRTILGAGEEKVSDRIAKEMINFITK